MRQLDRLSQQGISVDEVEEVGTALGKAGNRALSPLVRRLWREKNGDLVARYAYLLEFFDDEAWLDQLIQITLRRRDLANEGRIALLAALAGCGVDTSLPPFDGIVRDDVPSLPGLLEQGDEGMLRILDDILGSDGEGCRELIRRLPTLDSGGAVPLLEALLTVDDLVIRREAVTALGRIRRPEAAELLQRFSRSGDAAICEAAGKSLRRLAFLGIQPASHEPQPAPPFHEAWASWRDASGFGTVWISRWRVDGGLDGLYLHIHDEQGICAAWGCGGMTLREYEARLTQLQGEDGLVAVPVAYALDLIRDGSFHSREQGSFMPADVYLRHAMFAGEEMTARAHVPRFPGFDREKLASSARLVAAGPELFEDDAFAGWYLATGRVYDLADEWRRLEETEDRRELTHGVERLVKRFIEEICLPEVELLCRRLFGIAEMMLQTGRERSVVERVLAMAGSIDEGRVPLQRHPFLQRLALESMDMAREALAEGYDLRSGAFGGSDTGE